MKPKMFIPNLNSKDNDTDNPSGKTHICCVWLGPGGLGKAIPTTAYPTPKSITIFHDLYLVPMVTFPTTLLRLSAHIL